MAADKPALKQGEVNPMTAMLSQSIENQALLKVLLNAIGELTAQIQQKDAMEIKVSLHERVEKARKAITNTTFGYPADYEGELTVKE